MFYTGIDPFTGKKVYCETDYHQKQLQRALLQWSKPGNAALVREALVLCHREDLIGFTKDCLVRPDRECAPRSKGKSTQNNRGSNGKNAPRSNAKFSGKKHSESYASKAPKARGNNPRGSKKAK
jgi:hypothetical protein